MLLKDLIKTLRNRVMDSWNARERNVKFKFYWFQNP